MRRDSTARSFGRIAGLAIMVAALAGLLGAGVAQADPPRDLFAAPRLDTSVRLNGRVDVPAPPEPLTHTGLGDPCGVTVDSAGDLYVGDFNNTNVVIYDATGTQIGTIGNTSEEPLPSVCDIAVDSTGAVYVGGFYPYGQIIKYLPDSYPPTASTHYKVDPTLGGGSGVLVESGTSGVSVNPANDDVYVAEGDHISRYDSAGNLISDTIGTGLAGLAQVEYWGVDVYGANGDIYVTETLRNKVYVLNPAGSEVLATIDGSGSETGTFGIGDHRELAVDQANGNVYIGDTQANGDVQEFTAEGEFIARLPGTFTDTNSPSGAIAVDRSGGPNDGVVYVTSATGAPFGGTVYGVGQPVPDPPPYHFELSSDGVDWQVLPDHLQPRGPAQFAVVSTEAGGLQPSTTYHYRLITEDTGGGNPVQSEEATFTTRSAAEVEPQSCPNEDLRIAQHSRYLGECRGLEMVNPPDVGNQDVSTEAPPGSEGQLMSPDGNQVLWTLRGGSPLGTTGARASFLAERGPSGWASRPLVPPAAEQVNEGEANYYLEAATPSFSRFAFLASTPTLAALDHPVLIRTDSRQNQEVLGSFQGTLLASNAGGIEMSDDGSHVFYVNPDTEQLEAFGGPSPELVSEMPEGGPSECGLLFNENATANFAGGPTSTPGAGINWHSGYHRIATTDGSRAYFQVASNGNCSAEFGLYERNLEAQTTTLIAPPSADPMMIRATPNGHEVYFWASGRLDPADTNGGADVYRWDEDEGRLTCLTCVVPNAEVENGVLVSNDSSHVYFQSQQQLVPGAGKAGDQNIYLLDHGALKFVADTTDSQLFISARNDEPGFNTATARLSGDGNVIAFLARANPSLTSDEVAQCGGKGCVELYRYDSGSEEVECVSCLRGGLTTGAAVRTPSAENLFGNTHAMSADGKTIAFVTPTALVPGDINRGPDVYEWHDGVVHLVTDGVREFPATELGAPAVRSVSADGSAILFSTTEKGLTGFEQDGLASLYEARVDGGFLPPSPPAHCSEESCQGPLRPAPPLSGSGSEGLSGEGQSGAEAKQRRRSRCRKRSARAKRSCGHRHKHHHSHGKRAKKGGSK